MYGCADGVMQTRRDYSSNRERSCNGYVFKMAQNEYKGKTIVMCLSGRGDKDVDTVAKYMNGEETNK